jgi:hypothetical protein
MRAKAEAEARAKAQAEAAAKAKAEAQAKIYKPGDSGPAGGIVFYDKGNNSGGWRYLEFSPKDLGYVKWGLEGVNVTGTGTGIGSGKRNTDLILAALKRTGESGKPAQLCAGYTLNGYNDWFLPSKDELNELYNYFVKAGYKPLQMKNNTHWSSSQNNNDRVWWHHFCETNKGIGPNAVRQFEASKNGSPFYVRAIRAF